jgi:hypothetical protein
MSALVRPWLTTVDRPVTLDVSQPDTTLKFIAWLRDQQTEAVDVAWSALIDPELDTTLLFHLFPPEPNATAEEPDEVRRWRAAHRPGMCYYRLGPGFIQVKDMRQAETAAQFLLDEPPLMNAFTGCLRPCELDGLEPAERRAVEALVAERLLLRLGDRVTTLPSRMRRWPVPSNFV